MSLARLWRSLSPLGVAPLAYRALRGLRRARSARVAARSVEAAWVGRTLAPAFPPPKCWFPPSRFRFLGDERDLGPGVDWTAVPSTLWAYHLHYLEALRDPSIPPDDRERLLDDWIRRHPPGAGVPWDPFPVSLRVVNAIRMYLEADRRPPERVVESLARHALWLEGVLERDVGANHLFKNGVALAWAGRVLSGPHAARWRRIGDEVVVRGLAEQLLGDGFHYERSPGYHAVLVEDLLGLAEISCFDPADGLRGPVSESLRSASKALASVLHDDGGIALFNDAALDQVPSVAALLRDAATRTGDPDAGVALERGLQVSGLLRLRGSNTLAIFDAGEIGARRQPGHAHADTLSFEMSGWGRRLVLDAGTHGYAESPFRAYVRGTPAHNTVTVDGHDQSEMWGVFRVGRRARPFDVVSGEREAAASHDGYRFLPGAPMHRRMLRLIDGDVWSIEDAITGSGVHEAVWRLRFAPGSDVRVEQRVVEARVGPVKLTLRSDGPSFALEDGLYFPRFGERENCRIAVLRARGPLPIRFAVRLEAAAPGGFSVPTSGA